MDPGTTKAGKGKLANKIDARRAENNCQAIDRGLVAV